MEYKIKQEAFEVYGVVESGAVNPDTLSVEPEEGKQKLVMAVSTVEFSDGETVIARHLISNPEHPEAMSVLGTVFHSQAMGIIKELKSRGISIHHTETLH